MSACRCVSGREGVARGVTGVKAKKDGINNVFNNIFTSERPQTAVALEAKTAD